MNINIPKINRIFEIMTTALFCLFLTTRLINKIRINSMKILIVDINKERIIPSEGPSLPEQ